MSNDGQFAEGLPPGGPTHGETRKTSPASFWRRLPVWAWVIISIAFAHLLFILCFSLFYVLYVAAIFQLGNQGGPRRR